MHFSHNLMALAAAGAIILAPATSFAGAADIEAAQMAATPVQATDDSAAESTAQTADDSTVQAADASAARSAAVGMPNPMVPAASYSEMAEAISVHPLYFPLSSGLELQQRFIIGGTVADLRYASRYGAPEKRAQFTVRTVVADPTQMTAEALSGVYGADWKDMTIGSTAVQLAEVSDSSFVAYWTKDGVCFSVGAENVNRWDFLRQVRDNLIDLTEHYY
ncbi:hypothetical protein [Mitsuokella multacida]|uniref:hypothetical protein n=1 Tax=Mitsuokella multacida TaxID=52226 RepID=UPI0026651313|nr:hypothetical protein [Mitsuokella multacida]